MINQKQQLRILQKISPQQIQFIKLLQIPTANLEQRVKEEIEKNPALEDFPEEQDEEFLPSGRDSEAEDRDPSPEEEKKAGGEEFDMEDYLAQDAYDYRTHIARNPDDEEEDYETPIIQMKSLYDVLNDQLAMLDLSEHAHLIGEHLIGSLEEDGYLRRPIRSIVNDLAFRERLSTTAEEVEEILEQIQNFDPPGIGARDLGECLLIQLRRKPHSEITDYAIQLIDTQFEEFSKKHFSKIRSRLGLDEETFKEVYELIRKLNPKPGESESVIRHQYIIPDFILTVDGDTLDIRLNSRNAPELKVSRSYINMYKEYKGMDKSKDPKVKETLDFVKNRIESAQWFIDAIRQRQFTLLNTMESIAGRQKEFFLSGGDEKSLKPMILKDIAEAIEMDISTISRVANSKYVQTDFGIYPLKFFFTEGIMTDDGEVSNREVKSVLQEIINAENKRKPLSDDKIAEILKKKGYNIARRTVAKYREQLNLPVARLRKEV
jgi:RNA polymerase sigma-54 factor